MMTMAMEVVMMGLTGGGGAAGVDVAGDGRGGDDYDGGGDDYGGSGFYKKYLLPNYRP